MTDKNGDDDKRKSREKVFILNYRDGECVFEPDRIYERATAKVALGNLFIQREIEQARDDHTRLKARIENLRVKIEVSRPSPKQSSPPATATLLLAFIAPKNTVQAFLGDLEEVFHKNAACFGERQARRQYWMQVFASLGPLLWQWVKRMGFFTVLVDYFRSKFGF